MVTEKATKPINPEEICPYDDLNQRRLWIEGYNTARHLVVKTLTEAVMKGTKREMERFNKMSKEWKDRREKRRIEEL